jgi:hypothetical protein
VLHAGKSKTETASELAQVAATKQEYKMMIANVDELLA